MVVDSVFQNDLTDDEVNRIFRALADATRRDILRRTLVGEVTVSNLAADYDMSFAAVQKHVAVLERAGLLTKRRQGREALARGDLQVVRSLCHQVIILRQGEVVEQGECQRVFADPQNDYTRQLLALS